MPSDDDKSSKEQDAMPPAQEPASNKADDDAVAAASVPSSGGCDVDNTQITCDVLCSLSTTSGGTEEACDEKSPKSNGKCGTKAHGQLPMFLSKTYHMIDRCDPEIATWSEAGDNFVVKNVEKFASSVLPCYFKHSNFSSFARQLNFYGFRKLKAEPILTADYDARTACYVRFFHENFRKDRPDLLVKIKRATKSDMQSKDDVESLKMEIAKLKECFGSMCSDYDRRLAEMSYEYNRRITTLSAEYDKLAMLMQKLLAKHGESLLMPTNPTDLMHSLSQAASLSLQTTGALPVPNIGNAQAPLLPGDKRPAADEGASPPPASRPRTG